MPCRILTPRRPRYLYLLAAGRHRRGPRVDLGHQVAEHQGVPRVELPHERAQPPQFVTVFDAAETKRARTAAEDSDETVIILENSHPSE